MKTAHTFLPRIFRYPVTAAVACTAACIGMAACAATTPYNPDDLGAARIAQVSGICQTVMGLQPSERPEWGVHPGDAHLDAGASHYQGCVASLSDSLRRADTRQSATSADQSCRSQGFAPGSAALAVCVLQSLHANNAAATAETPAAETAAPDTAGLVHVGSFFYASSHETVRREQLACAELGLEPPGGLFAGCVRSLQNTFFAIDNPVE